MKSEDAALALISGVGNRLLAAATYATADQALHEQGARTVET